jgi:ribose transport system substrate-binding protein
MKRAVAMLLAGITVSLCGPARAQDNKSLALVTNAAADFWTIARRGVEKAQKEHPALQNAGDRHRPGDGGRTAP